MSDEQAIRPECDVAADLLEKEGFAYPAALLRNLPAQIRVLEVPPGSVCVLELPEWVTLDDHARARLRETWQQAVPGTVAVLLEDGLNLRAVLSQLPGP